jgi:PAS domain S-box-containing protein
MTAMYRIIYVDDEPDLLEIGKSFLEDSGEFTVTTALSAPEAIRLLEQEKFDAIISDYQMPVMDGIQFLVEVRTRFGLIPFILFTGRGREEIVIQAINSGADFYLQKGGEPEARFAELAHKVGSAASRIRAEEALRKSEEKYRHLIEHSDEAIVVAQDGMLKMVNHRVVEFTGYSEQELLSMSFLEFIHPDDRAMVMERYQMQMQGEELPSRYAFRLSPKDGSISWVEISVAAIDWEGRPATLNFLTDINDRKRDEEALRESEKVLRSMLDATPAGVGLLVNRVFQKVNHTLCKITEYSEEEMIGQSTRMLYPDDEEYLRVGRELYEQMEREGLGTVEARLKRKDGAIINVMLSLSPFDPQNLTAGVTATVLDITERKRAEEVRWESVERFRHISDLITDFAYSCKKVPDGPYIIDWITGAIEKMTGYTTQEIHDMTCWRFLVIEDDLPVFDRDVIGLSPGESTRSEIRIQGKDGRIIWLASFAECVTDPHDPTCHLIYGGCRDISRRKRTDEAIRLHTTRVQILLELNRMKDAPDPALLTFALDSSLKITESQYAFIGFMSSDESVMTIHRWSPDAMKDCAVMTKPMHFPIASAGVWGECVRRRAPTIINDYVSHHPAKHGYPEGHVPITSFLSVPIVEGEHIVAVMAVTNKHSDYVEDDINALSTLGNQMWEILHRKRAEETIRTSETKYRQIVDTAAEGIWQLDEHFRILYVNQHMADMLGYTTGEMIGEDICSFMDKSELADFAIRKERQKKGTRDHFERKFLRKDGSILWTYVSVTPVFDADGTFRGSFAMYSDLTNRKLMESEIHSLNIVLEQRVRDRTEALSKANEALEEENAQRLEAEGKLKASYDEKVTLLKEIHHRVKNNLQIIASLLNLQSRYIKDETTLAAIRESQNRVKAMALVHEKLYRSEDIAHISLHDYIKFLGTGLFQFYDARSRGIQFTLEIHDVDVDIDAAIPLGLIINELISNSLKYAFPEGRKGEISISVKKEDHTLTVLFRDTGTGIPVDLDWRNTQSLGLRLVITLVDQMNGTVELDRSSGTQFTLVLHVKE